jgi:hypothetical protein
MPIAAAVTAAESTFVNLVINCLLICVHFCFSAGLAVLLWITRHLPAGAP